MVTLRQAAQRTLDALEIYFDAYPHMQKSYVIDEIIDLRAALAEQPAEQEPEGNVCGRCGGLVFDPVLPQPRREVELTDEEIDRALDAANVPELPADYESVELEIARAVIAAYKAKQAWDRSIETFSDEQLLFELVRRNGFQRAPAKTEWYGDDWVLSTVGVGADNSVSITMNRDDFEALAVRAVVGFKS